MHMRFLCCAALLVAAALAAGPALAADGTLSADHRSLQRTISFAEMETFLQSLDGTSGVSVSVEGTSTAGRPLYVVHLNARRKPAVADPALRPAARRRGLGQGRAALPGPRHRARSRAAAGRRRPVGGADGQPGRRGGEHPGERGRRRPQPRSHRSRAARDPGAAPTGPAPAAAVAVDCHEFGRDSAGWLERGWLKWPDITMDSLNNPLFDRAVREAALRFLGTAADAEARAGHPFLRYWVGGVPPDEEQRHSAPDIDGGLNGLGMYGGLSFIIEAAARHAEEGKRDQDLGNRVDAYLVAVPRASSRATATAPRISPRSSAARQRPLPAFLPTNYLWVNPDASVTEFPVIEIATGRALKVPTANLMTDDGGQAQRADAARLRGRRSGGGAVPRPARAPRHPVRGARGAAFGRGRDLHAAPGRGGVRRGLQPLRGPADRQPGRARGGRARRRQPVGPARGRGRRARRAGARAGRALRPLPVPDVSRAGGRRRHPAGAARGRGDGGAPCTTRPHRGRASRTRRSAASSTSSCCWCACPSSFPSRSRARSGPPRRRCCCASTPRASPAGASASPTPTLLRLRDHGHRPHIASRTSCSRSSRPGSPSASSTAASAASAATRWPRRRSRTRSSTSSPSAQAARSTSCSASRAAASRRASASACRKRRRRCSPRSRRRSPPATTGSR